MNIENSKEFKEILDIATKSTPSLDFTNIIMGKVKLIDLKNAIYKKYIKRSWFFIVVAAILSLKVVLQLSYVELAFADIVNQYLPGASQIFTFILLSLIVGLFLYQFNNLVNYRFAEKLESSN